MLKKLILQTCCFCLAITLLTGLVEAQSTAVRAECEVHRVKLEVERKPVIYGLVIIPESAHPGYFTAGREQFPNANTEYYGGCVVEAGSPEFVDVSYCRKCRDAKMAWLEERQPTPLLVTAEQSLGTDIRGGSRLRAQPTRPGKRSSGARGQQHPQRRKNRLAGRLR